MLIEQRAARAREVLETADLESMEREERLKLIHTSTFGMFDHFGGVNMEDLANFSDTVSDATLVEDYRELEKIVEAFSMAAHADDAEDRSKAGSQGVEKLVTWVKRSLAIHFMSGISTGLAIAEVVDEKRKDDV